MELPPLAREGEDSRRTHGGLSRVRALFPPPGCDNTSISLPRRPVPMYVAGRIPARVVHLPEEGVSCPAPHGSADSWYFPGDSPWLLPGHHVRTLTCCRGLTPEPQGEQMSRRCRGPRHSGKVLRDLSMGNQPDTGPSFSPGHQSWVPIRPAMGPDCHSAPQTVPNLSPRHRSWLSVLTLTRSRHSISAVTHGRQSQLSFDPR